MKIIMTEMPTQIHKQRKLRRGRPDSPAGTEPFLTGVSGGRVLSISSGVTAGPKLTLRYLNERCEQNRFDRTKHNEHYSRTETNVSTRTVEHKAIAINLMNINSFNKTLE